MTSYSTLTDTIVFEGMPSSSVGKVLGHQWLMIAGDFNIHVDDATDTHASKLSDILSCHSLHQHVYSPTHVHGHKLDLLITRDDQSIAVLPVDPPLLSDHAFVVDDCSCPVK